jgi:hypothetical protein
VETLEMFLIIPATLVLKRFYQRCSDEQQLFAN